MICRYENYFSIDVKKRESSSDKLVFTSLSRSTGQDVPRISKMLYMPKATEAFLKENISGSFSSGTLSLIEFAINFLISDNKKLISQR